MNEIEKQWYRLGQLLLGALGEPGSSNPYTHTIRPTEKKHRNRVVYWLAGKVLVVVRPIYTKLDSYVYDCEHYREAWEKLEGEYEKVTSPSHRH